MLPSACFFQHYRLKRIELNSIMHGVDRINKHGHTILSISFQRAVTMRYIKIILSRLDIVLRDYWK